MATKLRGPSGLPAALPVSLRAPLARRVLSRVETAVSLHRLSSTQGQNLPFKINQAPWYIN
jgi:hypothetical protein